MFCSTKKKSGYKKIATVNASKNKYTNSKLKESTTYYWMISIRYYMPMIICATIVPNRQRAGGLNQQILHTVRSNIRKHNAPVMREQLKQRITTLVST